MQGPPVVASKKRPDSMPQAAEILSRRWHGLGSMAAGTDAGWWLLGGTPRRGPKQGTEDPRHMTRTQTDRPTEASRTAEQGEEHCKAKGKAVQKWQGKGRTERQCKDTVQAVQGQQETRSFFFGGGCYFWLCF